MNGDIVSIKIIDGQILNGILNYASIFEITNLNFFGIYKDPNDFENNLRVSIDLDKNVIMSPSMNIKYIIKFIIETKPLHKYLK